MKVVYDKLLRVQAALNAPKGQRNGFGNYNYRSCEDILEAVKPLLVDNEATIIVEDEMHMIGDRIYVRATAEFVCVETGESVKVNGFAREAKDKQGMDSAQVTGATSSYARKYALNGLLLTDDNKDPDHDSYSKPEPKAPAKPAATPKPAPAPAPAPAQKPAPAPAAASDDVLLEESGRNAIISNFEKNGVEIWDLEKKWGASSKWTKKSRREMLAIFTRIVSESDNYSSAELLEEINAKG